MVLRDKQGQQYCVHFYYPKLKHNGRTPTSATLHPAPCAKKERPCETPGAVTAIAWCSPSDPFKKPVGRKIALMRAMEQAGITRDIRRQLWQDYLPKIGVQFTGE